MGSMIKDGVGIGEGRGNNKIQKSKMLYCQRSTLKQKPPIPIRLT